MLIYLTIVSHLPPSVNCPYLDYRSETGNIEVNRISPDNFGNVNIPLSSLIDVQTSDLLDKQVLAYSSSSKKWINSVSSGTGGASALSGLTDCAITTPFSGQILKYIGSKWVNALATSDPIPLSSLSDC